MTSKYMLWNILALKNPKHYGKERVLGIRNKRKMKIKGKKGGENFIKNLVKGLKIASLKK